MEQRESEADEFYDELAPGDCTREERAVMRQAFAGMIWGKQYYGYDVARWLDGDPGQPPPPASRLSGRNSAWRHLLAADIMSMPDAWEYPWFAAWDLGFQAVVLAHLDPAFAKYQLLLLCREWMQNPNGALPAYEWAFGDVNPPVHAWAAMKVWAIDGGEDHDFLERVFLQAAGQLHLVGQPQGQPGAQRLRGRLPRTRQHLGRSTARTCPAWTRSSSPTRPAGWPSTA